MIGLLMPANPSQALTTTCCFSHDRSFHVAGRSHERQRWVALGRIGSKGEAAMMEGDKSDKTVKERE